MNCSSIDLKAYALGESSDDDRRQVEDHLASCPACGEEVERLRLTESALLSVADEEIPQRIAFVSDKVFEPSWWQRFWRSGPALGFAGATMLAVAIVVHALVPSSAEPPTLDTAAVEQMVAQEVALRVDAAVNQAVTASETRQAEENERLLKQVRADFEMERESYLVAIEEAFDAMERRDRVLTLASLRQEDDLQ
jgi:anti-sigma factor RsiW